MLKAIHGGNLGLGECQSRLTNILSPLARLEMDLAALLTAETRAPEGMVRMTHTLKETNDGPMVIDVPVADLVYAKKVEIQKVLQQVATFVKELQQAHERIERFDPKVVSEQNSNAGVALSTTPFPLSIAKPQ